MNIFFLDIDGVMATSQCWGRGKENKWGSYMFDPKCVALLNFLLQDTGAEIILSSDWKNQYTLFEMREIFAHNGVIKGPIGFTPDSRTYRGDNLDGGRGDEINMWLKHHADKDDIKWVAIDDLYLSEKEDILGNVIGGVKNFVHCPKHMEGIKQTGIKEKILEFFK